MYCSILSIVFKYKDSFCKNVIVSDIELDIKCTAIYDGLTLKLEFWSYCGMPTKDFSYY